MNKNFYKLVFSKVQSALIAVGENARGYNHNQSTNTKNSTITHSPMTKIGTLALSLWSAVLPVLPTLLSSQIAHANTQTPPPLTQSQIVLYEKGDPNYRPTLLRSDNNIPIVNIRTINQNGVSRNQFGQFDIDEKGVVLNNARFSTNSHLAGQIDGNMWLLSGEANTIVNEIYSPNPTQLNGKIEVAGKTANVIIANPSGLTINGGEFINAGNSILTTGQIQYQNGAPTAIQVDKGAISVFDKGLSYAPDDNSVPKFAQLFSQTINLHGKLVGSDKTIVQLVTGQNHIGVSDTASTAKITPKTSTDSANQAPSHFVSTDIGQLGQVYAGGIHIASTAAGSGVKQSGQLNANHFIALTADGNIVNTGSIKVGSDSGQILLKNNHKDSDISNSGIIESNGISTIESSNDFNNQDDGRILGKKQTEITSGNDINFHKIHYSDTDSSIKFKANNQINTKKDALIDTKGSVELIAEKNLKINQSNISAGSLAIASDNLQVIDSKIQSKDNDLKLFGGQVSLSNNDIKSNQNLLINTNNSAALNNNIAIANNVTIGSEGFIHLNGNNIGSSNQFGLLSNKEINLNNNTIKAKNNTIVSQKGDISVLDTSIYGESLHSQGKNQEYKNNKLDLVGNIGIHSKNDTKINDTDISSNKHLAISSKDGNILIDNPRAKSISANGLVSIQAHKDIKLNQSTVNGGAIVLNGKFGNVDWQNATLTTKKHDILSKDKQLSDANGSLTIKSHQDITVSADKKLVSAGDLELHSDGNILLQGQGGDLNTSNGGRGSEQSVKLSAGGNIHLSGKNIELNGSDIIAGKSIRAYATEKDLVLSTIKSDIAPIRDEERIQEVTIQLTKIETQIAILNNDADYQNIIKKQLNITNDLKKLLEDYKAVSKPSQKEKDNFKKQQTQLQKELIKIEQELENRQLALGISKDLEGLKKEKSIFAKSLEIAKRPFKGLENKGANLSAGDNIELISNNGISIQQATLDSNNQVIIQALGVGKERQIGTDKDGNPILAPFAITIEGLHDIYQRGQEHEDAFSLLNNYQSTKIRADKGILIQAVGDGAINPSQSTTQSNNNILVIGGDYKAKDGNIVIQSLGSTILQAGQDSSYDKETTVTKKGYVKRKTENTITTEKSQIADVVKLTANNIQVQAGDDIYAYGTEFNAKDDNMDNSKNHLLVQAGDGIHLYAVKEINQKDTDTQKVSKFLGIRYNKEKTHSTQQILTELPTELVADITNTQSGSNTVLQGTQFKTLESANLQAGVGAKAVPDAKIIFETISSTISEENIREFNNLVWQSISQKGSINETAELPSFIGVTPTMTATGGLSVQVPINKDDPNNKEHLVSVIQAMSREQGFSYLNDIIKRDDVDFTAVRLAQENWNYKQEGLTPEMAALITVAVAIVTGGSGAVAGGMGASLTGATAGTASAAMANAAFSSLISQASISLINNKGDIEKTLKQLGKSETAKHILKATISAGATQGLSNFLDKSSVITLPDGTVTPTLISTPLARTFAEATGNALTENLLYGTDLETALKNNLKISLTGNLAKDLYGNKVKNLDNDKFLSNIAHKLGAGLAGCASAKLKDQSCEAGAVGAIVGEMVGDLMTNKYEQTDADGNKYLTVTKGSKEYDRIVNTAKLTAGSIALLYEFDVNTAVGGALEAVVWNTLSNLIDCDELCEEEQRIKKLADTAKEISNNINEVGTAVAETVYPPAAVASTAENIAEGKEDIPHTYLGVLQVTFAKKVGFWDRVKGWFGFGVKNKTTNSDNNSFAKNHNDNNTDNNLNFASKTDTQPNHNTNRQDKNDGVQTPNNYIFNIPTKQAYDEAQKVKEVMNSTVKRSDGREQPLFSQKNNRTISVITHQDGTVSVGISGNNPEQIARLQKELDNLPENQGKLPNGQRKYRVGTETLTEKQGVKQGMDDDGKLSNKPGQCAEPHCATSSGQNTSPITGSVTIWRGKPEDLKHPYTGDKKFGDDQMDPCPTCTLPHNQQIYHKEATKSQNKTTNSSDNTTTNSTTNQESKKDETCVTDKKTTHQIPTKLCKK